MEEEKGFTIVDKRHGREEDELEQQPATTAAPPQAGADQADAGPVADAGERLAHELPAMDFATFLISLSTSALYHLGLVAEQENEPPPEPDLPMARQTIDLLEMLEEKTRGNLSDDEEKLLESMLYELRMQFVEVQRRS